MMMDRHVHMCHSDTVDSICGSLLRVMKVKPEHTLSSHHVYISLARVIA